MEVIDVLEKSLNEQGHEGEKYAKGILMMLKMNGYEIVRTDELDAVIANQYSLSMARETMPITRMTQ